MPLLKGTVSLKTKQRMAAARKKRWKEDKSYGDSIRAHRTRLKFAQLHGAFSTNPVHEQPMDEFDSWTY